MTEDQLLNKIVKLAQRNERERPSVLSSANAFRKHRASMRREAKSLEAMAQTHCPDSLNVRANFLLVSLEIEQTGVPPTELSQAARAKLDSRAEEIWTFHAQKPLKMMYQATTAGLGASSDNPQLTDKWVERVRMLQQHGAPDKELLHSLAHSAACALASLRRYSEALSFAVHMDPAAHDTVLVQSGILFSMGCHVPGVALFDMQFGHWLRPAAAKGTHCRSDHIPAELSEGQVLILLSFGPHGLCGMRWSRSDKEPDYRELIPWNEVDKLRRLCGGFPGLAFLAPDSGADSEPKRLRAGESKALRRVWLEVLKPMLPKNLKAIKGIDLLAVGWLAGLPWHAVGPDPRTGDVIGNDIPVSLLPGFWWLGIERSSSGERGGATFVQGDDKGIECACEQERKALEGLGFVVIRSKQELVEALQKSVVIHFSGHGSFPKFDSESTPQFAFADGSRFTTEDFLKENIQSTPPVVTMSTCELGFVLQSDGNLCGFPGMMIQRGTRSLVAHTSLLHPDVATRFFSQLYTALSNGERVGKAVVAALGERNRIKQGCRDIRLWLPFVAYGDQWLRTNRNFTRLAQ